MRSTRVKSIAAVLAFGLASAANAGVSEDFAGCDGLKKPKSADDGMRGEATVPSFGDFGRFGGEDARSADTIASCNRAFASAKLLPAQAVRRAHLLRARAAAKLRLGAHDAAVADLDAAQAALAGITPDPLLQRSLGLSLHLMRAAAFAKLGRESEAAVLADAAARQRPYALAVQVAAAVVQRAVQAPDAPRGSAWINLIKIEPDARDQFVGNEIEAGNFAGAVQMAADHPIDLPAITATGGGAFTVARLAETLTARVHAARLAYAYAATGDAPAARRQLALVRDGLVVGQSEASSELIARFDSEILAPAVRHVEARIALSEGRMDDARALMSSGTGPVGAISLDLAAAYRAAAPDEAGADLPTPTEPRRLDAGALAGTLLIKPETAGSRVDYKKSRPDILRALVGGALSMGTSLLSGIGRTAGFRSTPQSDGAVLVEYIGNTTSGPVVQEMTLLRAAELAREAGKSHLRVEARNDYQRYLVASQYGREISRTLSGYKTELTVRFVDGAGAGPSDLEAATVVEALGAVYYDGA